MLRPGRPRERLWIIPVVGMAAALVPAIAPWPPFGMGRWPVSGAFGAFTWGAWVISTGLAFTLLLMAVALQGRRSSWGVRRVLTASAGFALLAIASFLSAARADLIVQNPLAALAIVIGVFLAFQAIVHRVDRPIIIKDEPPAPRWRLPSRVTVGLAVGGSLLGGVALFFACGAIVRMIGPGPGTILTVRRPSAFFWAESAYYDELADRAVAPGRRALLPVGSRVVIKSRVTAGVQVRVVHDPAGKLGDELGYVRLRDLDVDGLPSSRP